MDDRANGGEERAARGRRGLERLRSLARLFDQAFAIPGTRFRFGIDALFGLVPGLGDVAGAMVAVYALHVARTLRAPATIQLHMLSNIAIDATVGTVPVLGDLFDFFYKAQTRNLALLEAWAGSPAATARRSRRGLVLMSIAIVLVFAALTVTCVWLVVQLFRWLF